MALTVLGRPPGLAQIPLSEAESEMLGVSISSPNSPAAERPYSPQDRLSSPQLPWVWTSVAFISWFLKFPFLILTSSVLWPLTCLPVPSKNRLLFLVTSLYFILSFKHSVCLSNSSLLSSKQFLHWRLTFPFCFSPHRRTIAVSSTKRLRSCKRCSQKSSRS